MQQEIIPEALRRQVHTVTLIPELEAALKATHTPYRRFEIAGFVIYQPAHRVPGVKLYEN